MSTTTRALTTHVIQHVAFEDAGVLGDALRERGHYPARAARGHR
ncbi:hypothetical protein ACU4HD_06035 [Cupriavidus basilensis]